MKVVTFQGPRSVRIDEVPKPSINEPRQALVKISLGAICGSDLHIYHGNVPMDTGDPLGHEFVGVVEEVGSEVRRFKPGDRVVAAFYSSCGDCAQCRKGWFSQCESRLTFGFGRVFGGGIGGAQAEFVIVPIADHTLEPIPAGITDEQAIFVGDILSTGFFAAQRAEIKPGDAVAIIGAGPVGLMATMCANLFGPAMVFSVDMVDSRLEMAQEFGAIPVNATQSHPVEAIQAATGGLGADSSIEAVGSKASVDTAIRAVRGGGTISMVGVPAEYSGDFPYYPMWEKSLTFRSGICNVLPNMRPLLDLIAAGRLKPESIISHRMKLDQAAEAYRMFDAREATKIVLKP